MVIRNKQNTVTVLSSHFESIAISAFGLTAHVRHVPPGSGGLMRTVDARTPIRTARACAILAVKWLCSINILPRLNTIYGFRSLRFRPIQ